ncbi:hypothetical protein [Haloferax sulfurifontis]|uniref:Uncharacterized protein n=2 Tax=Haloferax sulfurifontis TaxID=255616 RepID=M0IM85_9EURY|nr:hypothetical protein [Haloferax sulfurifontis]ELZ96554.1 hypothetical protein C441_04279 [Haloferax sulfurifontis ATCC BAA-897]GGC72166.1 hypothetical protein GCM10007209_37600 [Haloferax sulfurifontis]
MTEDIQIEPVDLAAIRYQGGAYTVAITKAMNRIDKSGGSLFLDIHAIEDMGVLPGMWTADDADEVVDKNTRKIHVKRNQSGESYRVNIPERALEDLGLDPEEVRERSDGKNPMKLTVLAGDDMIVFQPI